MSESQVVAGKVRKYYAATARGREALDALRPRLAELVGETLPEEKGHAPATVRRKRPKC